MTTTVTSIPRIVVAGTHSGSGKTTVTLAILSALARRGLSVQAFKTGPDFIDPSHHTALTSRPSRNLDTWMLPETAVLEILAEGSRGADISIIEGVMGLFDGFGATEDAGSTAHLAKMLKAPVILVVDAKGISRSAAAMVQGYIAFDPGVHLAGVIFNNVGGPGHYELLKKAVEHSLSAPVLGFVSRNSAVSIPERHLGLVPSQEQNSSHENAETFAALAQNIDLDLVLKNARKAPALNITGNLFATSQSTASQKKPRIAVAWDSAFHFYYRENLQLLAQAGAELVYFSPLTDKKLPADTAMLYIGGGFPEMYACTLAENTHLREEIQDFILVRKKPAYAECGGLMYLCQAIRDFEGKSFPMVGVIPADAVMGKRRAALGYIEAEILQDNLLSRKGEKLRGHEFHWSYLEEKPGFEKLDFAYRLAGRSNGKIKSDGIMIENMLASYAHLHFANAPQIADRLIHSLT